MFEYRFQSGKRSKNGYRSVINSYYHTVELTDEFIEQYVKQYRMAMAERNAAMARSGEVAIESLYH